MFGLSKEEKLGRAVLEGRWGDAGDLLNKGASPKAMMKGGMPVFFLVLARAPMPVIDDWLDRGIDLEWRGGGPEHTALIATAHGPRTDVLQKLLDRGANIDQTDSSGLTSLMAAAYLGNERAVSVLLSRGANTEIADGEGFTALMFAAKAGATECVVRLLEAKANPNARDKQGSTPIMFAAQHGYLPCVAAIVAAGGDINARGTHGYTALKFAEQNKLSEMTEWLQAHGATV